MRQFNSGQRPWKLVVRPLVAWTLSCGAILGAPADKNIRQRIAEIAQSAVGWKGGHTSVYEEEALRRPACSFYTVGNDARLDTPLVNYAVVGDKIIGIGDGETVAKILDICSHDAPAVWSAEIVTRYHRDLGGGVVIRDEATKPGLPGRMSEAGLTFIPPTMDKNKLSLTFLLWDPGLNVVYRIHATQHENGPVRVEKTQVLPAAR